MGNLITRMYKNISQIVYPLSLFQQLESALLEIQLSCDSARLKVDSKEFIDSLHFESFDSKDYSSRATAQREIDLYIKFKSKLDCLNKIIVNKVKLFNSMQNLRDANSLVISDDEIASLESIIHANFQERCAKAFIAIANSHLLQSNQRPLENIIPTDGFYAEVQKNKSAYDLQLETFRNNYTSINPRIKLLAAVNVLMQYLNAAIESQQLPAPDPTLQSSRLLTIEIPVRVSEFDRHNLTRLANRIVQQINALAIHDFSFLTASINFQAEFHLVNTMLSNSLIGFQLNVFNDDISTITERAFDIFSTELPKLYGKSIEAKDELISQLLLRRTSLPSIGINKLTSDIHDYVLQSYAQSYLFFITLLKFCNTYQPIWREANTILDCENSYALFFENTSSCKIEYENFIRLNGDNNSLLEHVKSLIKYLENGINQYAPQNETAQPRMAFNH